MALERIMGMRAGCAVIGGAHYAIRLTILRNTATVRQSSKAASARPVLRGHAKVRLAPDERRDREIDNARLALGKGSE